MSRESKSCSTHRLGLNHLRLLGLFSRNSLSCDKNIYILYRLLHEVGNFIFFLGISSIVKLKRD